MRWFLLFVLLMLLSYNLFRNNFISISSSVFGNSFMDQWSHAHCRKPVCAYPPRAQRPQFLGADRRRTRLPISKRLRRPIRHVSCSKSRIGRRFCGNHRHRQPSHGVRAALGTRALESCPRLRSSFCNASSIDAPCSSSPASCSVRPPAPHGENEAGGHAPPAPAPACSNSPSPTACSAPSQWSPPHRSAQLGEQGPALQHEWLPCLCLS